MTSNKFTLKCGNFAVLVDLQILPRGASQDTSWFTEHHKEDACILLKEAVDLKIKRYLETRKQHGNPQPKLSKELTPSNPLCIKGEHFRLAAYFLKRHTTLRCITQQQYCDLRVLPDRFVVCVSPHEADLTQGRGQEPVTDGASEYFISDSGIRERHNVSVSAREKKNVLKHMVTKISCYPKIGKSSDDLTNVAVTDAGGECEQGIAQPATHPRAELQPMNSGRTEDGSNTAQSQLLLPVVNLEGDNGKRKATEQPPQQQLRDGLNSTVGVSQPTPHMLKLHKVKMKTISRPCSQNRAGCAEEVVTGEIPVFGSQVRAAINSPASARGETPGRETLPKPKSHCQKDEVGAGASGAELGGTEGAEGKLRAVHNVSDDFSPGNKRRKAASGDRTTGLARRSERRHSSSRSARSAAGRGRSTAHEGKEPGEEAVPRKSRLRRPRKAAGNEYATV